MKTVLSIPGGGIRGLIPALVLAEIEKRCGRPIAHCFDLIAGTSTGGILAMGLALTDERGQPKYTASELVKIYETRGKEIFPRSAWNHIRSGGGMIDQTYSHAGLEAVLEEYFHEAPLSKAGTSVLITSYDITGRQPFFFKSWCSEHGAVLMKKAGRATSAAPTYFEPLETSVAGTARTLIDGGVFINSPSVSAYAEARKLFPEEDRIVVVSLGTGELIRPIDADEAKGWGKVGWLAPLLSCMFDGAADAVDYQMKIFIGKDYIPLQIRLEKASDDMDNVTDENIENLKKEAMSLIRSHHDKIKLICNLVSHDR